MQWGEPRALPRRAGNPAPTVDVEGSYEPGEPVGVTISTIFQSRIARGGYPAAVRGRGLQGSHLSDAVRNESPAGASPPQSPLFFTNKSEKSEILY